MSSDILIRSERLGKRFDFFRHPAGLLIGKFMPIEAKAHAWAVRNVTFEVHRGQCLGIIGSNGSGKSTLLGLLAGTQKPTEGRVTVNGRVVALLELGAGFHNDFTGRENVFLSASLYGVSGQEISQRFEEIERMAGIGRFIDRPVREYSSGMFARLAFAVAAHLDADILIVDEILGVGDMTFQQRCADFIRNFRKRGIVLLVSHSEHTILSLCTKAIWMDRGTIVLEGTPRAVTHAYHAETARLTAAAAGAVWTNGRCNGINSSENEEAGHAEERDVDFDQLPGVLGGGVVTYCTLLSQGEAVLSASGGEEVTLVVRCRLETSTDALLVGFAVRNSLGEAVIATETSELGLSIKGGAQELQACFTFELPYLPSGTYAIDAVIMDTGRRPAIMLTRDPAAYVFNVLSQHVSAGMANPPPAIAEFWLDGELLRP